MLIIPARKITREFPTNYIPGELDFCKAEFTYDTKDIRLLSYTNVIVDHYGRLFNSKMQVVTESLILPHIFKPIPLIRRLKIAYTKKKRRLPKSGRYLLCFDEWSTAHYHWFVDFLPRLLAVSSRLSGYTLLLPDTPYVRRVGVESLNLLQLFPANIEWIAPGERIQCDQLDLVTHSVLTGRCHDDLIPEIRKRLETTLNLDASQNKRQYISRAGAAYRKVLNEKEVTALFKSYGFGIIAYEDMSLKEQIIETYHSSMLASIHGAGLTNALFMKEGGSVLEFRRDKIYHNQCFWHLSAALKHKYYYQFGEPDRDVAIEGPHACNLTMPIHLLELTIEQMIKNAAR
ncbi:glycosyltransferase 61 family protein [Chitinophaga sp. OAE865]|uniref:glycosyltransferase family 61 protein n=1 Tax=Chitinophaga sp. OAE865 TaxID=2817898 RepID=UPI001AE3990B